MALTCHGDMFSKLKSPGALDAIENRDRPKLVLVLQLLPSSSPAAGNLF